VSSVGRIAANLVAFTARKEAVCQAFGVRDVPDAFDIDAEAAAGCHGADRKLA